MLQEYAFDMLCIIHIFFWGFVLLAFLRKKTAKINLYVVIPITYILHILPFHILNTSKQLLCPQTYEARLKKNEERMKIIYYRKLSDYLDQHCTFNPISPQGMMLFGVITSAYSIKFNKNIL